MTAYVIPLIFLTVLIASFFKKKDAYGMFVEGSKGAIELMVSVFPYLLTVMMAVAPRSCAVVQVAWEIALVTSGVSSYPRVLNRFT